MEAIGYMLFVFFMGTQGPFADAAPHDTLEACEAQKADVVQNVKNLNAKNGDVKIEFVSVVCAPINKAPGGLDA